MTHDLKISTATFEQARVLAAWAEREGWLPGEGDIDAFYAADPEGFLVGHLDGELVASASVIYYDHDYAFAGFYIVAPELRRQGLGHLIARAALTRVGDRVTGLDGVEAQVASYETLGFEFAHWTPRYGAPAANVLDAIDPPQGIDVVPVDSTSSLFPSIAAYDSAHVPAPRTRFVAEWLRADSPRRSFAALRHGELVGYATVRPAKPDGARIGPLFAEDEDAARALLRRCAEQASSVLGDLAIDVPTPNTAATALAEECAMEPGFRCARMYRGGQPELPLERIWGSTTFELG